MRQKMILSAVMMLLSGCTVFGFDATPTAPAITIYTNLTDSLVIFDGFDASKTEALKYQNSIGFVTLTSAMPRQKLLPEDYDRTLSPDGKWHIAFDERLNRFAVFDARQQQQLHITPEHIISLWQVSWSPDSRYLVYSANDQQGEWSGRIMLVDMAGNWKTTFLGYGYMRRWFAKLP